jgi:group I intron endonuclease
MKTGVYQIRNLINGKCYIGSAASRGGMCKRRDKHYSDLGLQRHHSKHLQNAWNKHGADAFVFEILEECEPKKCIEREQHYMDTILFANCNDKRFHKLGYNICRIAGSRLGDKVSQETRRKISIAHKGKVMSESARQKMRENHADVSGINNPNYGKKHSEATRSKISKAVAGKGMTGKAHSESAKEKISQARDGSKHSKETCRKMSRSACGKVLSDETKDKISSSLYGQWQDGTRVRGKKLCLENVKEIREKLVCGVTQRRLAEEFNVSRQTIGDIKNGRIWNI